jgi:hypothetical protein
LLQGIYSEQYAASDVHYMVQLIIWLDINQRLPCALDVPPSAVLGASSAAAFSMGQMRAGAWFLELP